MPASEAWPRPKARYIKTFTAIWDVPLNGGEGALVPRSHRLLAMPQEILAVNYRGNNAKHNNGQPQAGYHENDLPQETIPNCVRLTLSAGSQVCFDTATYHTSMPNTLTASERGRGGGEDGRSRCTVEVDYRTSGGLGGVSPSWQNADGAIARGTFQRLDAEGRLGRTRRRLLGLPDEGAVPDC